MPADLAVTNGRTAMTYAGKTRWHRLGTKLDEPATASEAIAAADLDYPVVLKTIVTADGVPVPQRKAVVRNDSRAVLSVINARRLNQPVFDPNR